MLVGLALLARLLDPAIAQTLEQQSRWCADDSNLDRKIAACTAAILSGQLRTAGLATTLNRRGLGYYEKGRYDLAIEDYDHAIGLSPNHADAFFNRGDSYYNTGQYDRAIQDYDQAIRLNPNDDKVLTNRGIAYDQEGQYDRAIADFDQAIRLNPNNAEAFNSRCCSRASLGAAQQALLDRNESMRLRPGNGDTLDSRGLAYLRLEQAAAAKADYDAALVQLPHEASSLYGRGVAEIRLSDQVAGRQDIAEALRLDPTPWPTNSAVVACRRPNRSRDIQPPPDSVPKQWHPGEHVMPDSDAVVTWCGIRSLMLTAVAAAGPGGAWPGHDNMWRSWGFRFCPRSNL